MRFRLILTVLLLVPAISFADDAELARKCFAQAMAETVFQTVATKQSECHCGEVCACTSNLSCNDPNCPVNQSKRVAPVQQYYVPQYYAPPQQFYAPPPMMMGGFGGFGGAACGPGG